jgi:uncharacterized protein (TIGR03435 family)
MTAQPSHQPPLRRTLLVAATLALATPTVFAQANAAPVVGPQPASSADAVPVAFDVVTIKRNKTAAGPAIIDSPANGDTINITNMSLRMMISFAYDMELHDQINGLPDWADSASYDLVAKVAESDGEAFRKLLPRQRNPLLQPVLEDRFHLKLHYQTKDLPAYALVIANPRNGPKLTAVEPSIAANGLPDPGAIHNIGRNQIKAEAAPITILISVLTQQLGRPVVDRTGLNGRYDFTLKWTPDLNSAASTADADAGPSLFTAVQEQLGLKLDSTKAPAQVLVVDHAERPTDN